MKIVQRVENRLNAEICPWEENSAAATGHIDGVDIEACRIDFVPYRGIPTNDNPDFSPVKEPSDPGLRGGEIRQDIIHTFRPGILWPEAGRRIINSQTKQKGVMKPFRSGLA